MPQTRGETRNNFIKAVSENAEAPSQLRRGLTRILEHLVGKSKLKRSLGPQGQFMLNVGLESVDPDMIEVAADYFLETLEDGPEKTRIQELYSYYQEHREDILQDNEVKAR